MFLYCQCWIIKSSYYEVSEAHVLTWLMETQVKYHINEIIMNIIKIYSHELLQ